MKSPTSTRQPKTAPVIPPSRAPEQMLSPRNFAISAIALAAAVFAVYSPSLNFQFILDDHRFLSDPRIQSAGHLWDYFSNYVWAQFTGGPPSFYRPVFVLWLRINFVLSGMSSWGWHFLSIGKHVAVAALLGWLVWKLLKDRTAALIAASLFALHPAQAESVAWVTVPDPLMCIAALASVLLYLKYAGYLGEPQPVTGKAARKARKAGRTSTTAAPSPWWLVGAAAFCFAALLVKETAIVLPVTFFVVAFAPPGREHNRPGTSDTSPIHARLLRAVRETIPFLCAVTIYLLLRFNALGANLGTSSQHLPWRTVVLSWPATLWFYIRVLFWPAHSYAFADPDLASAFSTRGVLLPALAVLAFLAVLIWFVYWAWNKSQRDFSNQAASRIQVSLLLGVLFLMLPILPALDLNALNPGDFLHGRYTYFPLLGLMILLATGWRMAGRRRELLAGAAALLAVVFAVITVRQEPQWRDDSAVFTTAHELAPHNQPVARNLADTRVQAALQLDEQGQCSRAIPVFQQVAREYPEDWYAWAGMGDCQMQLNDLAGAEQSLHRAADLSQSPQVKEQWQAVRDRLQQVSPR